MIYRSRSLDTIRTLANGRPTIEVKDSWGHYFMLVIDNLKAPKDKAFQTHALTHNGNNPNCQYC